MIFAAVFIGVEVPPCKAIWEGSGPQIMYGQVVTHGLWFFGLAFGWLCGLLFLTKQETEQAAWVDQNKQAVGNFYGAGRHPRAVLLAEETRSSSPMDL